MSDPMHDMQTQEQLPDDTAPLEAPDSPASTSSKVADSGAASASDEHDAASPAASAPPAAPGWPWARIARPAVIALPSAAGPADPSAAPIDVSTVAAIDFAVHAARDALADAVGLPIALALAGDDAAVQAPQGFGVALSAEPLEALIMFDPQAVRLLANAVAMSIGAAPAPAAPGPVAQAGDVDKGIIEYLALIVLDRLLRNASAASAGPVIRAFADGAGAAIWLQKNQPRCFSLTLKLGGSTGIARLYLAGLDEARAAAVQGCLSMLDWAGAGSPMSTVNIALALPAIALAPQEFAGMQPGDVLLLGGPSLTQLPSPCELVTDTHWSLGQAIITHDTPTYLNATFSPGQPSPRAAALIPAGQHVIQPILGQGALPIDRLARWPAHQPLPLTKEPAGAVSIYHGIRRIAQGELIILGSELGVRLIDAGAAT